MTGTPNPSLARRHLVRQFGWLLGAALVLPGASVTTALAQGLPPGPSAADIVKALRPSRKRGITRTDPAEAERLVRVKRANRSVKRSLQDREELYDVTRNRPQVDLVVYFPFNSADVTPEAAAVLDKLGQALTSEALRGAEFTISGHTDQKGTADFNLPLSQRRADAVRDYLVSHFKLSPASFISTGYGFTHLKNPQDPYGADNRRVQIANITN